MPKIDPVEIARIKSELDIVAVIRDAGVELEKYGAHYRGICPFHPDTTPSLVVNQDRQLFNCFGCKVGGDALTFLMKRHNLPFIGVIQRARAMRGSIEHSSAAEAHATPVGAIKGAEPGGAPTPEPGPGRGELLRKVWAHYGRTFQHADRASSYLAGRAISVVAQRAMQLGYCDGSLLRMVRGAAELKGELKAIGVLNDRGKEHLRGCVVFPLTEADTIVNLYGRRMLSNRTAHLFLPGPKVGMYNAEQLEPGAPLILCEGIIDAATLIAQGIANVLPLCGTTFTAAHRELVDYLRPEVVHLALDGDRAGLHAAEDIGARLHESGHRVHLVELGEGVDVNDYFVKLRGTGGDFRALLEAPKADLVVDPSNLAGTLWPPCGLAPQGTTSQNTNNDGVVSNFPNNLVDLVAVSGKAPDRFAEPEPAAELAQTPAGERVAEPAPEPVPLNRPADAAPAPQPQPTTTPEGSRRREPLTFQLGGRSYRVLELPSAGMRVTLQITGSAGKHIDKLDLYSAKARESFARGAATKLDLGDADAIERDLIDLIDKLEVQPRGPVIVEMTEHERHEAMKVLRSPDLVKHILQSFRETGYIGEEIPKLVGYLGTVSRLLDDPIAVLIVSRSGAGKSGLQDAVCSFVPPEVLCRYTRLSPQALFYGGEDSLKHKVLAIEEEGGASDAAYPIRNLQSAQVLRTQTTRTDPGTGRFAADEYVVYGPVFIILTTTSPAAMDYETRNRFFIVCIDESREQTQRILAAQRHRETLDGVTAKLRVDHVRRLMQNVQRLLKPVMIVNPYADRLAYMSDSLQMRREQKKYLALIRAITCLHQHQREVKHTEMNGAPVEYIEVAPADIRLANEIAREVLGRSIDELAPPTRNLLRDIVDLVGSMRGGSEARITLTRKIIREGTRWTDWQLRQYLPQLVEMEYLIQRGRNGQLMHYELIFDGDVDEGRRLPGLIDVDDL